MKLLPFSLGEINVVAAKRLSLATLQHPAVLSMGSAGVRWEIC